MVQRNIAATAKARACGLVRPELDSGRRPCLISSGTVVNGPRNLPSLGRAKFPSLAGLVISRWRDRRLHAWVGGRGAWAAASMVEVGSEPLIGCAQARGRRAGADDSSNPRSG